MFDIIRVFLRVPLRLNGMQHESSPSRRRFLGATAGSLATVATAGCLGSLVGGSSSATVIEPVEPSEPREGSPGEFYYFLEENGIAVDELLEDNGELYLTYRSDAETVDESNEEIRIIYEVYRQALIDRGSDISFLYSEIANPFDEQALGWGINSEWLTPADSSNTGRNTSAGNETPDNTADNETAENESAANGHDMVEVMIWSNIMNSKVYEEDLENGNSNLKEEGKNAENGDDLENESTDSGTNESDER
ncbi:hypothetical protein JMJ58_11250 [Haloterrigena salifodinae]|uniref:DUF8159 domain-containing protein n=2 Tax=Haloterrigena salifodinae TaxID=2675099 RepID=A0A8T8DW94_9EURY|nr:hypothetical protein JMJ58_11250 [Haloterrigena salifodinae]